MLNGPSVVVSRVPLELSDAEIKQGLVEGSSSLLEPQNQEVMDNSENSTSEAKRNLPRGPHKNKLGTGQIGKSHFSSQ